MAGNTPQDAMASATTAVPNSTAPPAPKKASWCTIGGACTCFVSLVGLMFLFSAVSMYQLIVQSSAVDPRDLVDTHGRARPLYTPAWTEGAPFSVDVYLHTSGKQFERPSRLLRYPSLHALHVEGLKLDWTLDRGWRAAMRRSGVGAGKEDAMSVVTGSVADEQEEDDESAPHAVDLDLPARIDAANTALEEIEAELAELAAHSAADGATRTTRADALKTLKATTERDRKMMRSVWEKIQAKEAVYAHVVITRDDDGDHGGEGGRGAGRRDSGRSRIYQVVKMMQPAPVVEKPPTRFLLDDIKCVWGRLQRLFGDSSTRLAPADTGTRPHVGDAALGDVELQAVCAGLANAAEFRVRTAEAAAEVDAIVSAGGIAPSNRQPHWRPVLDVRIVLDFTGYPRHRPPQLVAPAWRLTQDKQYLPIIEVNPLRAATDTLMELNDTVSSLPVKVMVEPLSVGKWQFLRQMDASMRQLDGMGLQDKEMDDVVRLYAETPSWVLVVILTVTCIHMLLDMMAIKADVSFWHNTKSFEGLSQSSLVTSLVSQLVIAAYLREESASALVLYPSYAWVLVTAWKLARISRVTVRVRLGFLPVPQLTGPRGSMESRTRSIDRVAFRTMAYLLVPVVIGLSAYSLVYVEHKGWYAWALHTAVKCVYAFGFALMTPQLFINFKLKSVAHLPLRVMLYRSINTFIDDLFAFIIRMPTAHRLSCFRDDIVFVVYMYQRYIYPVDKTRPAEGGGGPLEPAADGGGADAATTASSSAAASPAAAAQKGTSDGKIAAAAGDGTAETKTASREAGGEGAVRQRRGKAAPAR